MAQKVPKARNPIDLWGMILTDPIAKSAFDKITHHGIGDEQLRNAVNKILMASNFPRRLPIFRRKGIESYVRRLITRLSDFANEIEAVHKERALNPESWGFYFISGIPESHDNLQRDLCELPNILRLQSAYLEFQFETAGKAAQFRRQKNSETKATLELLELIRNTARRPLYPQIANILSAAFVAFGSPRAVQPDTLFTLYTRSRPRRRPNT